MDGATIRRIDAMTGGPQFSNENNVSALRGMIALRTADAIIRIYATNIGKLAAWLTASKRRKSPEESTKTTAFPIGGAHYQASLIVGMIP
ncbi:MAG: hypothetical protein ACKVQW_06065 [Pyrinomonadaceae bacterium]